jgi:hydroxymethylpyrimidine pyrophosphatase-like HAD family hydrolase
LSNYSGAPWDENWSSWNLVYTDFSKEISICPTKISVECDDIIWLNKILESYPELHVYLNNGENWSQVMHQDATKWNGIKALAQHFDIYTDEVAAFGDDYNDVEMLKNCGVSVAVENALDEAKTVAGYICGTNDEDGVAGWISRYIL